MKAMLLRRPAPVSRRPLVLADLPVPRPGPGEVLVRVEACGVCRTDLHVVEGELPPHKRPVVPGHQVVGIVEGRGPGVARLKAGDRVGVAWLHRACGRCRTCRTGRENLCDAPAFTGYDADGGYAELVKAPAEFVYRLPKTADPVAWAPLLCAGLIGYRAFKASGAKRGSRLGLFGFGGSAHVVAQVARRQGCRVFVFTRGARRRRLARELGAVWVGKPGTRPPQPLDAAILFAPAGELVPVALEALDKGGTLALADIYMSDVPGLDYEKHLFYEKKVVSVTANTREDGRELLRLAVRIPLRTRTLVYPLERANEALMDLKAGKLAGAAVLTPLP